MSTLRKLFSWITSHCETVILVIIVGYFVARGLEYSLNLLPYIGPDERYHIDLITLFSRRLLFPTIADLGDKGFILPPQYLPSLYHFVLGKFLLLNTFGLEIYQFLRILNLILSTTTVLILYSFVRTVTTRTKYALFTIAVLTNIPMFSYLSASVNYDNLVNLLAALSFYLFYKLYTHTTLKHTILLATTLAAGALTKESFLPLTLAMGILTVVLLLKSTTLPKLLKENVSLGTKCMLVVLGLLTVFNVGLYGRNIFVYHGLFPQCSQVMSEARCATTKKAERLKDEHIASQNTRLSIPEYAPIWYFRMNATLLLHGGHKYVWPPLVPVILSCIFFLVLSVVIAIKALTMQPLFKQFLFLGLFYTVFLFLFVYLNSYLPTGFVHRGANGRYLFPLAAPLIVLIYKAFKDLSLHTKLILAISVFIFLFVLDYPYFKSHMDISWTRQWYSLRDENGNALPDYTYLETSTHTGEPYGWEPR